MKKLIVAFLLLLTSVVVFAQDSGKAARVVDLLGDAMTQATLKRTEALFSDNATLYWVDKKVYGKPGVLKYLQSQLQAANKFELSFSPDDGLEDENISTTWGTFAIIYGSGDTPISNRILGRYTAVAKNVGESWQIVSLHLSISRTSG
jgi:hypothetical protein